MIELALFILVATWALHALEHLYPASTASRVVLAVCVALLAVIGQRSLGLFIGRHFTLNLVAIAHLIVVVGLIAFLYRRLFQHGRERGRSDPTEGLTWQPLNGKPLELHPPARDHYHLCPTCNALFFHVKRVRSCPQCGSDRIAHTRKRPPWELECRVRNARHAASENGTKDSQ